MQSGSGSRCWRERTATRRSKDLRHEYKAYPKHVAQDFSPAHTDEINRRSKDLRYEYDPQS